MAEERIPCRGVLFDLDGTLVETAPDLWGALNHVLVERGHPPLALEQVRHLVGNGARFLLARGFWGEDAEPPEGDETFEAAVRAFLDYYRDHIADTSHPFPGVVATLERLRAAGLPLAVVTNKPEALSRLLLDRLGLSGYFSCLVGGDTLPERKPHPLPLRHALERLGVAPALGVMVGDSRTDADAAHAAGCPLVLVTFGYNRGLPLHRLGPDALLDRFDRLADVLSF